MAVRSTTTGSIILGLFIGGGDGRLVQRASVSDVLAALRPRRDGGWVMGVRRGFALLDGGFDALLA